jgi:hypothetical protein
MGDGNHGSLAGYSKGSGVVETEVEAHLFSLPHREGNGGRQDFREGGTLGLWRWRRRRRLVGGGGLGFAMEFSFVLLTISFVTAV